LAKINFLLFRLKFNRKGRKDLHKGRKDFYKLVEMISSQSFVNFVFSTFQQIKKTLWSLW